MQKKTIMFIAIFLLLFNSIAFATPEEITFQGVPWLSNEKMTSQILTESGFVRNNTDLITNSYDAGVYIKNGQEIDYRPEVDNQFQMVCFSSSLKRKISKKIAGYYVDEVIFSYAFDGLNSQLISTKVILFGADFSELKEKLKKVYGDGQESKTDDGYEAIVWKGENNSAVLLYTSSEGYTYQLIYGRLDAETIINECLEKITTAPDMNDLSGL